VPFISFQESATGGLKAIQHDPRHTLDELVAQVVIRFTLVAQARAIKENGQDGQR